MWQFRVEPVLWRWGPALVMMLLIFTASAFPSAQLPNFNIWDWAVKKGGHLLGYAVLALGYLRGLSADARPTTRRQLASALGLAGLYALSDELHQAFVPGRGSALTDVGIDVLGATLGLLSHVIRHRRSSL